MRKKYVSPDFEFLKFRFADDIMTISNPGDIDSEIPEDYKDGGNGDWDNPDPFGDGGSFDFDF